MPRFDDELPPEFDPELYVTRPENPDLSGFDAEQAWRHYDRHGRAEGRRGSAVDGRAAFLSLIPSEGTLLHIEPCVTPAIDLADRSVRRLAAGTTAALHEAAERADADPASGPESDLVWRGEPYRELTQERFEAVLEVHGFERQPCLITHLTNVASVLKPGARCFLIVADRRYGAAHYLPDSTLADVLEAYAARRTRHAAHAVIADRLLGTHDVAAEHWAGRHGSDPRRRPADDPLREQIAALLRTVRAGPPDAAVRAWHFTPESFRYLIETLADLGLSPFRIERIYWTIHLDSAFYAVLRVAA